MNRWTMTVASMLLVCGTHANAIVLCAAKSKKSGLIKQGAVARLRTVCKPNEEAIDATTIGAQGPPGAEGPEGPPGPPGPDGTGSTLKFVPADGAPGENGAALTAVLASITDASAAKPYTVHLAPGLYDVGAVGLDLLPFVDFEGSGRDRSIVIGSGSSDTNPFDGGTFGTVRTADTTTLRALTVRNTGGAGTIAVGVLLGSGRSRLQDVVVEASAGDTNVGVAPLEAGSEDIFVDIVDSQVSVVAGSGVGVIAAGSSNLAGLTVKDSTILVTGGGAGLAGSLDSNGSYLLDGATISVTGGGVGVAVTAGFTSQLVRNSTIAVSGGTTAAGFSGAGSGFNPIIESTRVEVSGGSTQNTGLSTNNGSPRILGSRILVSGTNSTAIRLGSAAFAGNVEVSASILSATTLLASVQDNPQTRFRIGATQLAGSTITTGTGTFVCTDSYTSTFTPLSAACS